MDEIKAKCIILLSTKSSGSSALQNLISRSKRVKHVVKTRHGQNETLYWAKAASVLNMPQYDMLDSEVPILPGKAKSDLRKLLSDNAPSYQQPSDDHDLIFGGWKSLCYEFAPVLFEKSPHHLHQWSALELINRCVDECPSIDFLIIGLVRNPMDTIYSRWSLNRTMPEKYQYEWLQAYKNLLEFKKVAKAPVAIIRYEDMVSDAQTLKSIYDFIGDPSSLGEDKYLHRRSISKWKTDGRYGFQLSDDIMELAIKFGYSVNEMTNTEKSIWPIHKYASRAFYQTLGPVRSLRRLLRAGLQFKGRNAKTE
ncbi:MAG: sulfotransferase [Thiohalomonadales bacterium]